MLNLTPSLTATRPTRKDGDGDLDCALGREDGTVRYHENIGTRYQPKFASNSAGSVWARAWGVATPASDPFSSIYVGFGAPPAWARLNGPQGPLTLFLGSVRGSFLAYQGNASRGSFQVRAWPPLPTFLLTLPSDPNPDSNPDSCWMGAGFAFRQQSPLPVHRKGSTIDDCRCSGSRGCLWHWEGPIRFRFRFRVRVEVEVEVGVGVRVGVRVRVRVRVSVRGRSFLPGRCLTPSSLAKMDVVAGSTMGNIFAFQNAGTRRAPRYELTTALQRLWPFWKKQVLDPTRYGRGWAPSFVDLNGDGMVDLVARIDSQWEIYLNR